MSLRRWRPNLTHINKGASISMIRKSSSPPGEHTMTEAIPLVFIAMIIAFAVFAVAID
jgi:hypothetical protein